MIEDQLATILRVRRRRSELFGCELFSDPAWDILLELFAAELGGRAMTLDDLPPVAPKSTLARWVSTLEERGLIRCGVDVARPADVQIGLSRDCAAKLSLLLSPLRRLAPG